MAKTIEQLRAEVARYKQLEGQKRDYAREQNEKAKLQSYINKQKYAGVNRVFAKVGSVASSVSKGAKKSGFGINRNFFG